jgi:hypothetical protein
MHTGEDPIASVAAARKFVESLVDEAWPADRPEQEIITNV